MKLRKLLRSTCLAGFVSLLSIAAYAQGAYVKLGGGYNWGIGSQSGSTSTTTIIVNPDNTTSYYQDVKRVRVNFGKGFTGNAAFGFMFNENLGAELEVGYLAGGKNKTSYQVNSYKSDYFLVGPSEGNTGINARIVLIQPSLIMVNKLTAKLNIYGRFGIIASKGNILVKEYFLTGVYERESEVKYKGSVGFGLQGALGLDFNLNDKYKIFSEIRMNNLSYVPNTYYIVKAIINGKDNTANEQQEITLKNSYKDVNNEAKVKIKEPFNFSSAGINIGLKYNF